MSANFRGTLLKRVQNVSVAKQIKDAKESEGSPAPTTFDHRKFSTSRSNDELVNSIANDKSQERLESINDTGLS